MRHLPLSLAIAAALIAPALHAQTPAAAPAPPPIVTTCPSAGTLDELVEAIDAAVSGPGNKDRTCFRGLFAPDARLIPIRVGADGAATPRILTVDDWVSLVAK